MNNEVYKRLNNAKYDHAVETYKEGSRITLCNDEQRRDSRFYEFLRITGFQLNHANSILDVGCGDGEFYRYLRSVGYKGSYTGIDINEKLIEKAKARFLGVDFLHHDIYESKMENSFSFVVASGIFNLDFGQDMDWILGLLQKMYDHATNGVVFNAISTYVNFRDKEFFYLDPVLILKEVISNISLQVELSHFSLPYNYTMYIKKIK